jgi:hypothetical protein
MERASLPALDRPPQKPGMIWLGKETVRQSVWLQLCDKLGPLAAVVVICGFHQGIWLALWLFRVRLHMLQDHVRAAGVVRIPETAFQMLLLVHVCLLVVARARGIDPAVSARPQLQEWFCQTDHSIVQVQSCCFPALVGD